MSISLIVAMDEDQTIGNNGGMPWDIKEDLKWFQAHTVGKTVLMGRKTFESIGSKPLPNRENWVMTRDLTFKADGVKVINDRFEFDIMACRRDEIMIIGGAQIYEEFLPVAQKLYITEIQGKFGGDTKFPDYSSRPLKLVSTWSQNNDKYSWKWKVLAHENWLSK